MPFNIIQNSTSTDQVAANENFYHIAQGSVLPMAGAILNNTNSTLDIGNSTYRWKTLFCNAIKAQTITSSYLWELSSYTELTSAANSFSIVGFLTSTCQHYKIIGKLIGITSPSTINIFLSNISSTASLINKSAIGVFWGGATSAASEFGGSVYSLIFTSNQTNSSICFEQDMNHQSSTTIINEIRNESFSDIVVACTYYMTLTITGLYFQGGFGVGSKLWIYKAG